MLNKYTFIHHPLFLLTGYLLLVLLAFPIFKNAYAQDVYAYITIAERYATGDYGTAINGVWYPLESWIIAFWLKYVNTNGLLAARILMITAGWGVLWEVRKCLLRLGISPNWVVVGVLLSATHLLYFIYQGVPDILLAYFALIVCNLTLKEKNNRLFDTLKLGIAGALGYFSKAYFFAFFPFYISILIFLKIFNKKSYRSLLGSLGIFIFLSGLWITCLSTKYGALTISTASKYKLKVAAQNETIGNYNCNHGLMPFNPNGTDAMEDISFMAWEQDYTTSSFSHTTLYLGSKIIANLLRLPLILNSNNAFAFVVFIALFFLFFNQKLYLLQRVLTNKISHIVLFCAVYASGYLLVYWELWYLLPIDLLLLVLTIYFLDQYKSYFSLSFAQKMLIYIIICVGIAFPSLTNQTKLLKGDQTFHWVMAQKEAIEALNLDKNTNIASDTYYYEMWALSKNTSFLYYGQLEPGYTNEQVMLENIKKYNIKYLFVYQAIKTYSFLRNTPELTKGGIEGLKIYQLF